MTDLQERALAAHIVLMDSLLDDLDDCRITPKVGQALKLAMEAEMARVEETKTYYCADGNVISILDNGD